METVATCGSCRFFSALAAQCRKNPPTAVPLMVAPGQMQFMSVFPPVKDSEWCGEHKPGTTSVEGS